MGYLLPVALALAFQALQEIELQWTGSRVWLVVLMLLVPHLLSAAARKLSMRGAFRLAQPLALALTHVAPFLHLAAITLGGWPRTLETTFGVRSQLLDWPDLGLLALFAPFVAYCVASIDARARLVEATPTGSARVRNLQLRMFASSILPFVLYVGIAWAAGQSATLRAFAEHSSLGAAVLGSAAVLVFVVLLPQLLALAWDTRSLPDGELRADLEQLARKAKFRCRDILEWRTGDLLSNAAVVGVTPRQRVVLLTDALMATLGRRELAAVFGHEIGHAKRHHVIVFSAWAVAFILGGDLLVRWAFPNNDWAGVGVLLAVFGLWALAFGWLSRRAELDADLYGTELTGDVQAMVNALETVGGVHASREATWRHFSTSQRASFLSRNALEPGFGRELRARLRVFSWIGFALAALALAGETVGLLRAWPQEAVRVDLARGQYTSARSRVAKLQAGGVETIDENLERQVERAIAAEIELDPSPVARLEALALEALDQGKAGAAQDYLELAALRGSRAAADVLDVLTTESASERARNLAHLRERDSQWGERVERFLTAP